MDLLMAIGMILAGFIVVTTVIDYWLWYRYRVPTFAFRGR